MDALEADSLRRARQADPATKLRQACELIAMGIRIQRSNLRRRHPEATEEGVRSSARLSVALLDGTWGLRRGLDRPPADLQADL